MDNNDQFDHTPLTSIIILTRNNLRFTRDCIFSIYQNTPENYELIIVDNGSTDGTLHFLKSLGKAIIIENEQNRGFSGGCNQGLSIANGENIVLLNNDTIVTNGWLARLLWQLNKDDSIGIVGPRSNFVIPEQLISPVSYKTMPQMHLFANERASEYEKQGEEVDFLSGLCMIFKRTLIDTIGGFDERFYPGYYEDADFCIRTKIIEKKLIVANDVFIHHYGSSSFKRNKKVHKEIIDESKKSFFDKWNIKDNEHLRDLVILERPFNRQRHYIPL
ncbi:glycosyltransferase family 2 protein [Lederbergia lenta]|uniref:glycosyltransferase family 2 protein n=1 Tax=Lederbergia lenta TaxID=1467 RepID=UPI00203DCFCB|nr:glycosyltransferase family 2 protein [Lederbergia lenta]MCM3113465.1 glycosyltransferase family 2 protein [Lederbergia lenta]